ncbi:acireductone dioxygenase-like [Lineus longissimus]|uniref:acireductone dioxygenase-like n=1 Tax=Lineus longissimus TaxID=88925 RepID=UPI002B4F35DF
MTEAWYMDDSLEDQRLPHRLDPPQPVSYDGLKKIGVLYWKLNPKTFKEDGTLDKIRKDRGYTYEDCIECHPEKMENYDAKLKMFFEEHLHTDEEIRFIADGSGYFDVRDADNRWIRIKCCPGDLIILPAGIYHRFTLDEKDYIKAMRLFIGEPVWKAHNRPADDMECRKQYVKDLQSTES